MISVCDQNRDLISKMGSEKKQSSSVSDVGAWGMNIVSSVGIIMANKQLMSSSGFGFSFGTFAICKISISHKTSNA